MQNCTLTTTKSTFRTDFMLTNLTVLTISKVDWQITREPCFVKGMTMKKILRISSKVFFSLKEWNCAVDLTLSCCTVSWASTFLQLRNYYIQIWKYESDYFQRDQISTWWARIPMLAWVLCTVLCTLGAWCSKKTITKGENLNYLKLQLSTTTWKHWKRLISFLDDRTYSFKKKYSTTHL